MNSVVVSAERPNKHFITPALWQRLVARIVNDEQIEPSLAERIVDQALAFLRLCAIDPEGQYSPSPTVDIGWHTLILYTREYAQLCTELAGRFIHHSPMDEEGVAYTRNAISRTVAAMKVRGLVVDEALWDGAVGDCGGHKCYTCTVD